MRRLKRIYKCESSYFIGQGRFSSCPPRGPCASLAAYFLCEGLYIKRCHASRDSLLIKTSWSQFEIQLVFVPLLKLRSDTAWFKRMQQKPGQFETGNPQRNQQQGTAKNHANYAAQNSAGEANRQFKHQLQHTAQKMEAKSQYQKHYQ